MNVIFAGTPDFAAAALRALLAAGHRVPLVLTQPDRPAGRGMQLSPSAVKQVALDAGIDVLQPLSLKRDPEAVARLRATPHEVMVVAAYGLILPQEVLDIPPRGCLNIHASLLPRWRGAAPIQRAIAAGDRETGVCIMRMEAGLDTGPVLLSQALPIEAADTGHSLHDKLTTLGASMIVDALARLDTLAPVPQPEAGVTYAAKLDKAEAMLDFREDAAVLERKVRAFDPVPGTIAVHAGTRIKVWGARPGPAAGGAAAGSVVSADGAGILVACGDDRTLALTELQRPGGKRLPAQAFLQGFPLAAGDRFDGPAAVET
jgi:methionyl-tRNA formyltransferase